MILYKIGFRQKENTNIESKYQSMNVLTNKKEAVNYMKEAIKLNPTFNFRLSEIHPNGYTKFIYEWSI